MIVKNDKYEIMTPSGWSSFHGVMRKESSNGITTLITTNGKKLECTPDHKIKTIHSFEEASKVSVGDKIVTSDGIEEIAFAFSDPSDGQDVYDVLEVAKKHEYYTNGLISHNCTFLGSSGTLISGEKLKEMASSNPIHQHEGLMQYEKPQKDHVYALIADVSRGKGLDYSAFNVIDITSMPYKQVCTFRDNFIGPVDYSEFIFRTATLYNEAYVMIEVNDIGGQVSDLIYLDYGYENIIFTENAGRSGKRVSGGFGRNVDRGIRTTTSVKRIGCSILKMLIEQKQLLLCDYNTIQELSRFSKKGNSYEAESGANDDLVMTLVLFSWLTDQNYFKDLTDINTIMALREKTAEEMEENMMPFGFIVDGSEEEHSPYEVVDWF